MRVVLSSEFMDMRRSEIRKTEEQQAAEPSAETWDTTQTWSKNRVPTVKDGVYGFNKKRDTTKKRLVSFRVYRLSDKR